MQLRDYQIASVEAVYDFIRNKVGNPCVVLPTAAGKSPVMAQICKDSVNEWQGRVLVLAHVKELLEQTAEKIRTLAPELEVGIYSAGLKRRDTIEPVIVAGIQSVHDKAAQLGSFDLILIDEAHLIPDSEGGMYRSLIADMQEINDQVKIVGLTATPYRLTTGMLCGPDKILTEVCYEVGVKQLINQGYLSKIVGKAAVAEISTEELKIVRGEFDAKQTEEKFTAEPVVSAAVSEILGATFDRKSVMLFCQGIGHAQRVAGELRDKIAGLEEEAKKCLAPLPETFPLTDATELAIAADWLQEHEHQYMPIRMWLALGDRRVAEVYGDTPDDERAAIIADFRAGKIQYLVNVNVLTTGFDAPNVDCVCLLRATVSPGLFYQMVGRGFRLSPGKLNCLVLDFGGNIERHGPVDCLKAKTKPGRGEPEGKICPQCRVVASSSQTVCLECGYVWISTRDENPPHDGRASSESPVSGEPTIVEKEIRSTEYRLHRKKGAGPDAPTTLRVTYQFSLTDFVSEWVCIEHSGFAGDKAQTWWHRRCRYEMPTTTAEALYMASCGWLAESTSVKVKKTPGKPFPEIVSYQIGQKPKEASLCPHCRQCNKRAYIPDDSRPGALVCEDCHFVYRYAEPEEIDRYGFTMLGNPIEVTTVNTVWDEIEKEEEVLSDSDIPF